MRRRRRPYLRLGGVGLGVGLGVGVGLSVRVGLGVGVGVGLGVRRNRRHRGGCGYNPEMTKYALCGPGLQCVEETLADFNCSTDACCTPMCDTGAPSCPMGFPCVPYGELFQVDVAPVLSYVGVCVP